MKSERERDRDGGEAVGGATGGATGGTDGTNVALNSGYYYHLAILDHNGKHNFLREYEVNFEKDTYTAKNVSSQNFPVSPVLCTNNSQFSIMLFSDFVFPHEGSAFCSSGG